MSPLHWFLLSICLCHHQAFNEACFEEETCKSKVVLVPSSSWICTIVQTPSIAHQVDPQQAPFARYQFFCRASPRKCRTALGSAAIVAKPQRLQPTIAVIAVPVGKMQTPTMSRQLVANPKSRSTSNRNGKTIPGATLVMASPRAHEVLAKILRGISDPSHLAKDATDRAKVVKKATTTNPSMDIMAKAASTNRSRTGQSILLLCPIQPKDSHQNLHGDRLSQACRRCHRSHRRLHHIRTHRLLRRSPS